MVVEGAALPELGAVEVGFGAELDAGATELLDAVVDDSDLWTRPATNQTPVPTRAATTTTTAPISHHRPLLRPPGGGPVGGVHDGAQGCQPGGGEP
ncbi:hypothetical protein BST20_17805 [Mycobacterium branderi]|uniref:Uncharacterized protein n=1 Tax=Mycobacterium branderi TaxID=43348 RepID=A0A7I7WDZ7_9MYCO|nr:hypothetical protein BST20_17805 [Mycobacterium branderi]BBZ15152.1 hypothetical protein MBRA_53470 [Mycobacterium branderi]